MRIYRSNPDDHFTILPNAMLRDSRLTYAARGILAELLTHIDGWETTTEALWKLAQRDRVGLTVEGRRALRSAFAELEHLGYMVRRKTQGDDGRFVTAVELYDTPDHRGSASATSVSATSVAATSESATSLRSTNERSTNTRSNNEEHSSALADTRAAAADASADIRASELRTFYEAVSRMDEHALRMALLKFEKRRPVIYGQCRRKTIKHLDEGFPGFYKGDDGPQDTDRLSYKYALQHYSKSPEWPAWLIRPLPQPVHLKSVS